MHVRKGLAALVAFVFTLAQAPLAFAQQFGGDWNTTFGRMQMQQNGSQVTGVYEYGPNSTIEGYIENGRLYFRYFEPSASGEGWFEMTGDGSGFAGQWRQDGNPRWMPWEGVRMMPRSELDEVVDEIVTMDSGSWLFWRYDRGSMHNTRVIERSGATTVVEGHYTFNGGSSGWVRVQMTGNNVDCIEFWNEGSCRAFGRPPSHALVGALAAAAVSGGGGGGGGGGYDSGSSSDYRPEDDPARNRRGYTPPPPPPPPPPQEPIGGSGGLYGCASPPCW